MRPNGQLIIWFPPFDSHHVKYCKIDVAISTAQSILVDRDDHIFVAAARPTSATGVTGAGVWEYSPPYPDRARRARRLRARRTPPALP